MQYYKYCILLILPLQVFIKKNHAAVVSCVLAMQHSKETNSINYSKIFSVFIQIASSLHHSISAKLPVSQSYSIAYSDKNILLKIY